MDPGTLSGPLLLAQPKDVRDRLARCLRGFSAPSATSPATDTARYSVSVPWGRPLDPWAVRFFVVDVIGGRDVGRSEKLAWAAPLEMDGRRISFAFTKFGVSATVSGVDSTDAASAIVDDCMKRFGKAIPVVTRDLIDPLITNAVARGSFSVPNKFGFFFSMFTHLRSLSEATAATAAVTKREIKTFKNGSSVHYGAADLARNAEYEAIGALLAFFSLLEHLLVIGLAFDHYDPVQEPFGDILRMSWGEKYKRVVGLNNKADKRIYDTLRLLADENRNPSAHGGVDRNIANVHVHLPGYGAVPTGVTSVSMGPTYTFEPVLPMSVHPFAEYHFFGSASDGWDAVDQVVAWMRSGPLANATTYGESGLPIMFDNNSRDELRAAAAANELDDLIDRRHYFSDQAANMDW